MAWRIAKPAGTGEEEESPLTSVSQRLQERQRRATVSDEELEAFITAGGNTVFKVRMDVAQ